jgi:hypothetical protein
MPAAAAAMRSLWACWAQLGRDRRGNQHEHRAEGVAPGDAHAIAAADEHAEQPRRDHAAQSRPPSA